MCLLSPSSPALGWGEQQDAWERPPLTILEQPILLLPFQDEKEQLIQSKSSVASLVGRSKSIVQLRPRNPEHAVKSTIPIKAVCDYRQIEVSEGSRVLVALGKGRQGQGTRQGE